jgi:hypothetical protein
VGGKERSYLSAIRLRDGSVGVKPTWYAGRMSLHLVETRRSQLQAGKLESLYAQELLLCMDPTAGYLHDLDDERMAIIPATRDGRPRMLR